MGCSGAGVANFEADTAEKGREKGLEELEELAAPELAEVPKVPELPDVLKLLEVLELLDGRDVFDTEEVEEVEEVDGEVVALVVPKLGLNEPEVGVTEGGAGAC